MNRYAIALGSNRGHGIARTPTAMIARAVSAMTTTGICIERLAPIIETAPVGPSRRRYANSAAVIETSLGPAALLATLKQIERDLGRRRGQRWGARSIDIDIIMWSGGRWKDRALSIPHPRWVERDFVLVPLSNIAADWRDPVTGLRVRHLAARHRKRARRPLTGEDDAIRGLPTARLNGACRAMAGP